ncbi:MAG: hypothetical protein HOP31_13005 [Ignavibacteria bacterium]|nr:hypothetical protein [Ignavibacteria bacterium]
MKKKDFFEPKNSSKLTELPDEKVILDQPGSPDYHEYPEGEDIYLKDKETDIDPEKLAERPMKAENGADDVILKTNPHALSNPVDTPGSELDDTLEEAGSEDEENNYYSLGRDNNDKSVENS